MVENNDDEGAKDDGGKSGTSQCTSTFLETNLCEKTSQSDGYCIQSNFGRFSDLEREWDIASVAANVEELGEILGRWWKLKENRVPSLMIRIVCHTNLKSLGENRRNKALQVCKDGEDDTVRVLTVAQRTTQYRLEEQPLLLGYRALVPCRGALQNLGQDSRHGQKG
jgi:hypothetical protein